MNQKTTVDLRIAPESAEQMSNIVLAAKQTLGKSAQQYKHFQVLNRSIDARRRPVVVQLRVMCWSGETPEEIQIRERKFNLPTSPKKVVVIGAGPAGLFAALKLLECGIQPVLFERGKDVRARRRDLAAINKEHIVNPESNYCFGEGGAGTYSDGKLYTRSKKRGDVRAVLETLVQFGADPNILVNAHPHIGTNKLPEIIVAMREAIIAKGGEVHFNSKLTGLQIEGGRLTGVEINHDQNHLAQQVILATGHSARDIFELLHKNGVRIDAKPFALGVRIEHPQSLIDQMQYHCGERPEALPPAAYQWTAQSGQRGVYSFCMCPGGIIAPCATQPGEVVTNGWSPSKRNNPFANSGVVVSIEERDWKAYRDFGPLAAMAYQSEVEKSAWKAGGQSQSAPAQRLIDFLARRDSTSLPSCSYQPGITAADLHTVLPGEVAKALHVGLHEACRKMKGYLHPDAVLVATESRTSSPVRIPRNPESLQHEDVGGLYPCGEGAGYAGGIVSAAIDGEKCALQCATVIQSAAASK